MQHNRTARAGKGQTTYRDDPIGRFLAALSGRNKAWRPTGPKKWRAQCPAHDDRRPSLVITRGDDDRVLLTCHAHCDRERIVEAVGLRMRDLYAAPGQAHRPSRRPRGKAHHATLDEAVARMGELIGGGLAGGPWLYLDREGTAAFATARYETPAGKEFRPFKPTSRGWRAGMVSGKRPLLGLRELAEASTVVVVEGEKCVEWARMVGILATTSANGSGSASRSDWRPLAGKRVVILPDNDEPGEAYAAEVAGILARLKPRPDVTILRLPGLAAEDDVADWLDDVVPDSWEPERIREHFDELVAEAARCSRERPGLRLAETPPIPDDPDSGDSDFKTPRCAAWLRERLKAGPVPSRTIQLEAKALGYSETVLQHAKPIAGAVSRRNPLRPGWYLVLDRAQVCPVSSQMVSRLFQEPGA